MDGVHEDGAGDRGSKGKIVSDRMGGQSPDSRGLTSGERYLVILVAGICRIVGGNGQVARGTQVI